MSKSYGNIIDIFLSEKELKKQVMSIVTDSTPLERHQRILPKTMYFAIYKIGSQSEQTEALGSATSPVISDTATPNRNYSVY